MKIDDGDGDGVGLVSPLSGGGDGNGDCCDSDDVHADGYGIQ